MARGVVAVTICHVWQHEGKSAARAVRTAPFTNAHSADVEQ